MQYPMSTVIERLEKRAVAYEARAERERVSAQIEHDRAVEQSDTKMAAVRTTAAKLAEKLDAGKFNSASELAYSIYQTSSGIRTVADEPDFRTADREKGHAVRVREIVDLLKSTNQATVSTNELITLGVINLIKF